MRFSVNVSTLFTEAPLLERFALASAAGFSAAECWWPEDIDLGQFAEVVETSGIELVLLNFFGGSLGSGDRGVLADPARAQEFRDNVPVALEVAAALGCSHLNALIGIEDLTRPRDDQLELAVENVRWAAERGAAQGAWVLIEPINPFDNGPYLVPRLDAGAELLAAVGGDNLGLQFDTYHVRRTEQPLEESVRAYASQSRHVQLADVPGRGAPGTGAIDFPGFLTALDATGYDGYVGLEYLPVTSTEEALAWLPVALRSGDRPVADVLAALG